jgi:hypothetical protein
MNGDQKKTVAEVFERFSSAEEKMVKWDEIDTQLSYLEYMSDSEIFQESRFVIVGHLTGIVCCDDKICNRGDDCFAKVTVRACEYILDDYLQSDYMPAKNRYVLSYYLALTHLGMISFKEIS